ncbi:hypothetical protein [Pseudolabrys sp.]|uniref:hypothetical protein n=1 Tax=Pseudolabrys sp. TaxID=1960880 RepID=UPI003D13A16E
MVSLKHSTQNDTRLRDFMSDVREFGRQSAQGRDALPMLAVAAVRAAHEGVISLDKDSEGIDDAKRMFDEYTKAEGAKAVHERTAGGMRANVSKLRKLVQMGTLTYCDPVDVLNRAVIMRRETLAADPKSAVKPAYAFYVDTARAQIEQDSALTDDQLKAVMAKPEGAEKTVEGQLERAKKILDDLISGENGLTDKSPEVMAAHEQITSRIGQIMALKDRQALLDKAAELGLTVVDPAASETAEQVASDTAEAVAA